MNIIHTDNTDKLKLKSGALRRTREQEVSFLDILDAQESGILVHKAFEKIKYKEDVHDAGSKFGSKWFYLKKKKQIIFRS